MSFPTVTGSNLLRQKMNLPVDFSGELNIVMIPFQQWHQRLVDTWIPFARQVEQTNPQVRYYELPTIYKMNWLSQVFLNEGMRAGIPDPLSRERTITLYLDKGPFKQALELPHEDDIYILLVDRQGKVLWREQGEFSHEKGADLTHVIEQLSYHNMSVSVA